MTEWVKHGDIVLVSFGDIASANGHEQAGYRPAVVVSGNEYIEKTNMIVAAPITTTLHDDYILHLKVPDNVETSTNVKTAGTVLCEQIRAIDPYARKAKVVGRMPEDFMKRVRENCNSLFHNS